MRRDDSFLIWAESLKGHDSDAAFAVFRRYAERLIGVAHNRLGARLRQKDGPEDVVQSVFRSFFHRQRKGDFQFDRWDDIWSLLVQLTIRKCIRRVDHYQAAKRDVRREHSVDQGDSPAWDLVNSAPVAEDVAALEEVFNELAETMDGDQNRILELSLMGHEVKEIARELGCGNRRVQRERLKIKRRLVEMQNQ